MKVSSQNSQNTDKGEEKRDRLLKNFNNALDDVVTSTSWNTSNTWLFGGASKNKFYFNMVPQGVKYDVML